MATYASRPAWELRARSIGSARVAAPLGLGVLLALSLLLRTRNLDVGFWVDEGLSVGIADRPLLDIPGVLRQDGSPPLYYMLLNLWMAVAGRTEESVHGLSVLFSLLCVPAAFWAGGMRFGRRTAWVAALLAAVNPFVTKYAQEGRMYALVILLGLVTMGCWQRAFTGDEGADGVRRGPALGFAVALAAMLYTHNWTVFFGAATGVAWLVLVALAHGEARRRLLRTGLLAYGAVVLLYAPWLPTTLYQAAHTGAPWSKVPTLGALITVPGVILGESAQIAILLTAGAGLLALFRRRSRPILALLVVAVLTVLLAWLASQVSPAWANRYLSVAVAPTLLLVAAGFAHAGRLGLAGLALVAVLWAVDGAPDVKSNARSLAAAISPSLNPGDIVVVTQPEQVSVLEYYLPDGLGYATLTGPVPDVGVTDWRDGLERLRATSPARDLEPVLDALPPGRRLALVVPAFASIGRWNAPWNSLVRERSEAWLQHVSNDRRFALVAMVPDVPLPSNTPNPLRARIYVKR